MIWSVGHADLCHHSPSKEAKVSMKAGAEEESLQSAIRGGGPASREPAFLGCHGIVWYGMAWYGMVDDVVLYSRIWFYIVS